MKRASLFLTHPAVYRRMTKMLAHPGAFRLPPVIRVRRRGFSRSIRRGDNVRRTDGTFRVIRRSLWHLWLEKTPHVGDTIRVRLPQRYLKETA